MSNDKTFSPLAQSFNRVWIVLSKEIVDNLRDRRSLVTALISTLITPLLLLGLIIVMGKTIFRDIETTTTLVPVAGQENAPGLVQYLEQNGIQVVNAPDDPRAAVKNGEVEIVLIIPEGYGDEFTSAQPAGVELVLDSSRQSSLRTIQKVTQLVNAYSSTIGALRLTARGISPWVTQALVIEQVDVATPESQAMIFLSMLPFLLMLVIFSSGVYVIIDTTAGERERNSLEPLMINPANRWELVLGKYLAALPFVIGSLALTLAIFGVGFNVIPVEEYLGMQIGIGFATLWRIFLLCLPITFFASAIQMIVATFTRSFKEAQTYVTLIAFVPSLPGAFLAFLPSRADLWKILIPSYGQQVLINQWMRGETVNPDHILLTTVITLVASLLLLVIAVQLYRREHILFGAK